MLKIFKKINEKIDSKIEEYSNENAKRYGVLVNRPLEGEIIRISNIKIQSKYTKPNFEKLVSRDIYYKEHGYFKSQVVLDENNYLVNGYTTYLLAKEQGFDFITIARAR